MVITVPASGILSVHNWRCAACIFFFYFLWMPTCKYKYSVCALHAYNISLKFKHFACMHAHSARIQQKPDVNCLSAICIHATNNVVKQIFISFLSSLDSLEMKQSFELCTKWRSQWSNDSSGDNHSLSIYATCTNGWTEGNIFILLNWIAVRWPNVALISTKIVHDIDEMNE